ncbi:MAG: roadblock/LC7 domain-containing protein [Chthoniobacterales bacterium]
MTIPFLNFFKKALKESTPNHSFEPVRVEKSSAERLSKTVMPNATRTIAPREEIDDEPAFAPPPRTYSIGAKRKPDLPPAVALALEPTVERVIALELRDVTAQMPAGWVRPVSDVEANRRLLLKAAEVEKGMATGKPCACLTSVYRQVPEIFVRPVPEFDETQVPLPFAKVLAQFTNVQPRCDQSRDLTVPQLETPFLRVALEDNTRFGTTMAPVQISDKPLVNMELATAETIAAAHPELFAKPPPPPPAPLVPATPQLPVTRAKDGNGPVIKLPVEEVHHQESDSIPAPQAETPPAATTEPTRIPFKLSPIGTGEPASERVPASSGPSVPTSSSTPTRIAFKMAPPSAAEPKPSDEKISLALKPILLALPPLQLTGDVKDVADDVRLEIPFSLVEPQLSCGRVSLQANEFEAILPEPYRKLFSAKEINVPVVLPLQDVLKNLPTSSLRMRGDQEEQEKGPDFQTPFSAKAAEDAKRLGMPIAVKPLKGLAQVVPKSAPATPAPVERVAAAVAKPEVPPAKIAMKELTPEPFAARVEPPKLPSAESIPVLEKACLNGNGIAPQSAPERINEPDAKAVMADIGKLAGVKGCAIMFNDGLSLAGNLPGEFQAEGLCAMAPSFLARLDDHVGATKLGAVDGMTLSCAKAALTFFMHDNLCLAALHAKEGLAPDVRERLVRAVHDLSRKYSQPA